MDDSKLWFETATPNDASDWRAAMLGAVCEIKYLSDSEAIQRRAVRTIRNINETRYKARIEALRTRGCRVSLAYWLAVAGVVFSVALAVWRGCGWIG